MSKIKEMIVVEKDGGFLSYSPVNILNHEVKYGEKALSHSFLMDSFRKIMGRTLTVIDASIVDKNQNKAIKDVIREIFSDEMQFASELAFDQEELSKVATESFDKGEMGEGISIEEALGVK